jgi:hypothetical protein
VQAAGAPESSRVEVQKTNFNPETLAELATTGEAALSADAGSTASESVADVRNCLRSAYPALDGAPVMLIRARFQGTDAFIGVFEAGPGAGRTANLRIVLAASVDGCQLLSYADYPI